MKTLPASQEEPHRGAPQDTKLQGALSTRPSTPRHQKLLENPVILALQRFSDLSSEAERQAKEKLRIADEVIRHLSWQNAQAAASPDISAVRAVQERSSKEQVQRTRAELDAYLHRARRSQAPLPPRSRQSAHATQALVRNVVLDALRLSESSPRAPLEPGHR